MYFWSTKLVNQLLFSMKFHHFILCSLILIGLQSCGKKKLEGILVETVHDFDRAVSDAKPGDVIVLANGIWKDAELLLEGRGTKEKPITLIAQEKGKVSLEGSSNLRLSGVYLHVEGLIFKNGGTPTGEVISFRKDKSSLANNSRVTACVIDNFNTTERHNPETWVAIYGKGNRIDHNHLVGKRNRGVTMTVHVNSSESQENYHKIDHNYFGPRQTLGSNGGETLRIGTSHFSLANSNTLVEANYFDRCNGEHEIISNKSCQNTFKGNVFYECTGTLTMRHGNGTLVENNVFFGNNKPGTGGIRVINGQQTVRNNYGIGLKGSRFRGALVVMNGVPNSPLNRYSQVEDAVIENNTFIDCDHIQLCAGSDTERSAAPINSRISNNIFYSKDRDDLFTVHDDISGIIFENNVISPNIRPIVENGFEAMPLAWVTNENDLLVPKGLGGTIGARPSLDHVSKENTGVSWYPKEIQDVALNSGKKISVSPGLNTLFDAVKRTSAGDIVELGQGTYTMTKTISVPHPLTIRSNATEAPLILYGKNLLFEIGNGGSLSLSGLVFDGGEAPDMAGNTVISTSSYSMNKNYNLFIDHCEFLNLDVNHSFDVVSVYKNTFADTISITNSRFRNISGNVIALDKEIDDIGIYNAEHVIMKNNLFAAIGGMVLGLYRGGTDESTFGPFLEMDHNVFDNVGHDVKNKQHTAVSLYGVQDIEIKNNIFNNSKGLNIHLVIGEPRVNVANNNFYNSDKPKITGDQKYSVEHLWSFAPGFVDDRTYRLAEDSVLKGKGTDGGDLGLIKS